MLPADVYARFLRSKGYEVLCLCATDEHGTPTELAAQAAGMTPRDFCDQQYGVQLRLVKEWNLSFDHFGRSSGPENREVTQHMAVRLKENGFIEERVTTQAYSIADERFLPDRYILGTCPHCGYENARGDQCENCTRVLDPIDLTSPRSAVSGSTDIEFRDSTHLFLLQSKMVDELRAWVSTKTTWPQLARSIALKWLDEGLHDRGITRDLDWGVPVPDAWPHLQDKVFYVWFDAPIEYISAAKEWAIAQGEPEAWKSWWYDTSDVTYTQFMAKDNVPFHTISFPATLLGTREPWKQVDYLKSFNWLTYCGGKFSTSQNRGVFMDAALDLLPVDVWRYLLLANAPESSDADFTWELVGEAVNKDLVGTLGNFVNRVITMSRRNFENVVPEGGEAGAVEAELVAELEAHLGEVQSAYENRQFRKAMAELRKLWSLGNAYLDRKEPWRQVKTDREGAAVTLRTAIGMIRIFGRASAAAMPGVAEILTAVGGGDETLAETWPGGEVQSTLRSIAGGTVLDEMPLLFQKVEEETLDEWRARYGS